MPGWHKETELRSAKSCANTISPFLFANTITNIEQSRVLHLIKLELYMILRNGTWVGWKLIKGKIAGATKGVGKLAFLKSSLDSDLLLYSTDTRL